MARVRSIDTGFDPSPWQLYFLRKTAKVKLALCGLGSGKSALGATQAALFMTDERVCQKYGIPYPNFGWVVGQDFPTVLNTSWREVKKFLPENMYQANEQLHRIRVGDSECQFVAADDPDSLRAGNVNWIWVDEPGIISNPEVWQNIVGRMRRGVPCVVFLTGTPKGFNWLYEFIWQKASKLDLLEGHEESVVQGLTLSDLNGKTVPGDPKYQDYWAIRIPSWLAGRASQDDIDQAEEEMSHDWFMQEMGADFRSYTGLVYPEFRREIHVSDEEVETADYWGGLDWGYKDPASAHVYGRGPMGWTVEDEFYEVRVDPDEQIEWALQKQKEFGVKVWWADSARPDLIDRASRKGLRVIPADKSPGSIVEGLEVVRRWLRQDSNPPGLVVRPKCKNLIQEFTQYRYPTGGTRSIHDVPLDKDNHALDEARYCLTNHEKTYGLSTMDPVVPLKKRPQAKSRFDDEDEDVKDEGYASFDSLYFVDWR